MAYMLTMALRSRSDPQGPQASAQARDRLSTLLDCLCGLPNPTTESIITRLHPQEALALPPPLPSTAVALSISSGCFDASLFLMRTSPSGRPIPGPSPLLSLAPPTTLTAIKLSGGALGSALGGPSVPWLITGLRSSPGLTRLDIDDLPHFTATAAAAMIRAAPNLIHLRIYALHLFNGSGALSKALSPLTTITHLDLSCNAPSASAPDAPPAATVKFATFANLSDKTALRHVALRIMPDRHLSALIPSIPLPSLEFLDITGSYKDSSPATDSLAILLPLLPRATRLSTLLLDGHCSLRRSGAPPFCETISSLSSLRHLALCAVHDAPYFDGALACVSQLTALSLDSLDGGSLRQVLVECRQLNELRLFNCGHQMRHDQKQSAARWRAALDALRGPTQTLRKLKLELLALGAGGHRVVLTLIENMTALEDLTVTRSLSCNTDAEIVELAPLYGTAVGSLTALTRLELREQKVETSLELLRAAALRLSALTGLCELKLQACEAVPHVAREMERSTRSVAADGCADELMRNIAKLTALTTLQLEHMAWSAPVAARAITSALHALCALRRLSLRGTPIGAAGAVPVSAALHKLPDLDHLDLRGTCIGMAGSQAVWLQVQHLALRGGLLFWGE